MVYQWAVFRHQRPILGAGCELFVVMLDFYFLPKVTSSEGLCLVR
ncbi:hypothetical protein EDB30_11417 [Vibrio crassostreae]|nr:hypothetical protein EDB30_11417 [Vibrio crassostreae]